MMSDDMLSLLKRYVVARDAVSPDAVYLFPDPKGNPYTAAFMQRKFVCFFRAANPDIPEEFLPPIRVYDLRYPNVWISYATVLRQPLYSVGWMRVLT